VHYYRESNPTVYSIALIPSIELIIIVYNKTYKTNHYVRSTFELREAQRLSSHSTLCACRFKLRFGVVIFLAILALHGSSHRRRLARCQCTVALLSGVLLGTVLLSPTVDP
jgi:hypothetical protein